MPLQGLGVFPIKLQFAAPFSVLGEMQLLSRDWLLCSKVILCKRQKQVDGGIHVPYGSTCHCSVHALADAEGLSLRVFF